MRMDDKIYVAGHQGTVGTALQRVVLAKGYRNLVTRTQAELDLTDQAQTRAFFSQERPQHVFLAAAKRGGIHNHSSERAEFIYQNLMIEANVIRAAYENKVRTLIFIASTDIYPTLAPQPLKEGYLLSGSLDAHREPDAIAKIAGIKMCAAFNRQYATNFMSVVSAHYYGPGESYDPSRSHVVPALIRRFHEAKIHKAREAVVWGSGNPLRELIFSDDLAEACVMLMEHGHADRIGDFINVGSGVEIAIKELAQLVARVVGFEGRVVFDEGKPDGLLRRRLDITRISTMGWKAQTALADGISQAYADFLRRDAKNSITE
ncbi:MAG: GDP-L-fucose synthase [Gammaproteobacteria bacterium]|nr:GDP-L-fucose synthase [Gammaproteobacteria bacterium]